jgi:hypothetical protein
MGSTDRFKQPGGRRRGVFLRARIASEVLQARTAKVRLQKMKAEIIDRA